MVGWNDRNEATRDGIGVDVLNFSDSYSLSSRDSYSLDYVRY